jgi:hypothetical protein
MSVTNCHCGQAPKPIINNTVAICNCRHLVYRRPFTFAPPSFAPGGMIGGLYSQQEQQRNVWTASADEPFRRQLILEAKRRIGVQLVVPAADLAAAAEAARMVGEDGLANDLEYEQWVTALKA